jgi:hypothetical protein
MFNLIWEQVINKMVCDICRVVWVLWEREQCSLLQGKLSGWHEIRKDNILNWKKNPHYQNPTKTMILYHRIFFQNKKYLFITFLNELELFFEEKVIPRISFRQVTFFVLNRINNINSSIDLGEITRYSEKWDSGKRYSGKWDSGKRDSGKWDSRKCDFGETLFGETCFRGNVLSEKWSAGKWNTRNRSAGKRTQSPFLVLSKFKKKIRYSNFWLLVHSYSKFYVHKSILSEI